MNVASWLDRAASRGPNAPAVAVGTSVTSTYADLRRRSAGIAAALAHRLGLAPGDRVAIAATNHSGYLEALFGIWWAGMVAVPINPKLHATEISWIAKHAGVRATFLSPDLAGDPLTDAGELIELGGATYAAFTATVPERLVSRDMGDDAWLFYTSGTTGRPKGAVLSHRNLMAMSLAHLAELDPTRAGDALIHAAPLSHGSGLLALPHTMNDGVHVLPESGGFDAAEVADLIAGWNRSSMFAAPTMVRRLVAFDADLQTEHLRTLLWGGAPMLVADTIAALERLGPCLAQIYGQGETPMTIAALSKADVADVHHPSWRQRLASAGTPRGVVEVRCADADGEPVATGELGEVLVRGDTVMSGYWQDVDATASALRDGWLRTGDVGVLDTDGYLTLKDRSKDLIISGGSNIYPREVEEVLTSHPAVREVSVIGRPDAEWGEAVVAYVVGDVEPQALDQLCLERIARFKRPKDYVMVDELPKSHYGKILKTRIRELDASRQVQP